MDDAQHIQEKMRSLGERYLRRTYSELDQLESTLGQLRAGESGALKELERMMHKIRGSGAMFGFNELSDCAGHGELLCVTNGDDPAIAAKLESCLRDLRVGLRTAADSRNVTLEHGSASPTG